MAFAHDTHRALQGNSLLGRLAEFRALVSERFARHRVYRQTVNELASLSDRDLHDLGLHRSMIEEVAREAAAKA